MKGFLLLGFGLGLLAANSSAGILPSYGSDGKGQLNAGRSIALYDPDVYHSPEWWLFDPEELHVSFGYSYLKSQGRHSLSRVGHYLDSNEGDGFFVNADYYLSRFFAIGGDLTLMNDFSYDGHAGAHLKARLPWDQAGLAFYLLGGVGASFGGDFEDAVDFSIGVGLEFRVLDNVSMIFDIRTVETGSELDYTQANYGLSIIF